MAVFNSAFAEFTFNGIFTASIFASFEFSWLLLLLPLLVVVSMGFAVVEANDVDAIVGVDTLDKEDDVLLLLLLLICSVEVFGTSSVTVPDDFSISLSKSMIKSPIPPTSHSLSSYSKLLSFDSVVCFCFCCC